MGFSNLPLQKDQIEYSICLTLLPPGGGDFTPPKPSDGLFGMKHMPEDAVTLLKIHDLQLCTT